MEPAETAPAETKPVKRATARTATKTVAKQTQPLDAVPAAPRTRSTTPSPETLGALSRERLIALVLEEAEQNAVFRKRVSAAIAALRGPDAVAALIDRRLAALEKARGYIDWQKRRAFAADLDATVATILSDLKALDPAMALDRLLRFLGGAAATLGRVDDSAGQVHAVYETAGEAAVALAAGLPAEAAARFTERLVPMLKGDDYGMIGGLLEDLVPRLPAASLPSLDAILAAAAAPDGKRGRAAGWEARLQNARLTRLRQTIADARGDVDAFIALETAGSPDRPDTAAVAERLLAVGRAAEALEWVRRPREPGLVVMTRGDLIAGTFGSAGPERVLEEIEIRVLDALGRRDEAQSLRWGRFERGLDGKALRGYLDKLPDFEDDEALERALTHAARHPDPHAGLYFLVSWPDLARAARLVLDRCGEWSGQRWEVLAPTAEALEEDYPLAASLLYRVLIDDILGRGRSQAYGHAARHLERLDTLAARLEPGSLAPAPATYRTALRKAHGRKTAFWLMVDE